MENKVKDIELWLGNCLEKMKDITDGSIDMICCDPPYKTTKRGSYGGTGGFLKNDDSLKGKGGFSENSLEVNDYLPEIMRCLKEGGQGILFTNDKNLVKFHLSLLSVGFKIFKTLVWAKNTCITNMYYMNSHEYMIFFRKGRAKKINNCGTRTVLTFNNPTNKMHPSEKPVDLLSVLIKNSTIEGDIVLDFTMGSGSTGIACINTNRRFLGIEIDETYFKIAKNRIEEHVSK
jgi:site-specific DNA-methyltransferase (adenine-specific)